VERIVVVGAGQCGATAVRSLLASGFDGEIALVNDEPDVAYERPPLSKSALVADEFHLTPTLNDLFVSAGPNGLPEGLRVRSELGLAAVSLQTDEHCVELADGAVLSYDRLLLATGAKPRELTIAGGESALVLRTASDARRLRAVLRPGAHVVVIGGGFIGLEVAASARCLGCRVTVLEFAPRLMGRAVPEIVAAAVAGRHQEAGVIVHCETEVIRLERNADNTCTVVTKGGTMFVADVVVAGVGAVANTTLAATGGLEINNGIVVDSQLRTSKPDVYAAGDCCSFPNSLYGNTPMRLESWRNAIEQGTLAAENLLGADKGFEAVPWFWSDQYELGLQVAGLPTMADHEVVRVREDGTSIVFGLDTDGRVLSAAGVAPGTKIAKDIRIAEMLIANRAKPSIEDLADPNCNLKSLLT
jgi:3-phenylpropionate/trans-cinnamate dioxygenase ferredoxin reductase component